MKRVAYFTNIAPHYRRKLWLEMIKDSEIEFHFFYGQTSGSIRSIEFDEQEWSLFKSQLHRTRNIRLKNVLVYQFGVISAVLAGRWDSIILLGDMYVFSNWIAGIVARIRGIKVYFWGHGMYGNEGRIKGSMRRTFLSLGNGHFLYGHYAKQLMEQRGFEKSKLHVVYNSLDYDFQKSIRTTVINPSFYSSGNFFANSSFPVLIFIGRLTAEKKIGLLLDAVQKMKENGAMVNLMIIGDGPEKQSLVQQSLALSGQVHFYGACYDEVEIGRLLANADLCVSPGNVGLTAIHSLSFGTPVCTHDDMSRQMPEAEAIIENTTGTFYNLKKDNLRSCVERWFAGAPDRIRIRENCYSVIDDQYNPRTQVAIFKNVLLEG